MSSDTQIKQLWRGFYLLLAVLVLLDPKLLELVGIRQHDPHHEAHFVVDGLPEFFSLFGLVICLATVVFAKLIVAKIVLRPDTYYDKSPLDPTRDSKKRPIGDHAPAPKEAH